MLNPSKCFFLHYSPRNIKTIYNPKYQIGQTTIERKTKACDLGVIISDDLSFKDHIDHICKRAKRETGRIRRSFKSRTPLFIANSYKTYVRPNIEYCVQLWNPANKGEIEKLEKAQNHHTRLLKHAKYMTPAERNAYLGLTSHEKRRLRGDLIQRYKYSEEDVLKRKTGPATRTNSKAIEKQRHRTNIRGNNFFNRNIQVWNQLPENVVAAPSVNAFKNQLDN